MYCSPILFKKGATVKKSLYAILVILLSIIGANAFAAKLDKNVQRVVVESNDNTGNDNHGSKACGTKVGK